MKTVTITLEQALVALECVENDISLSEFGELEFEDVEALQFYLKRAELLQRLKAAISAAKAD